jgi:hypothetical protein
MTDRLSDHHRLGVLYFQNHRTAFDTIVSIPDFIISPLTMTKKLSKTRYHLQKLTRKIERLEQSVPFIHPRSGTGVMGMAKEIGALSRRRQKIRELKYERNLVVTGLLNIERIGNNAVYKLTKDGYIQALKDRILLQTDTLIDALTCFVVFDIPEDIRKSRDAFRRFLKDTGFKQVQKSVWSTCKDSANDLRELIDALKLGAWVEIIVGESFPTKKVTIVPKAD